jgi:4-methylaminobutanoate oxidase (formaldehyde-forming)
MGYVPCAGESAADVLASFYQIDVAGTLVDATASLKPLYDPKGERCKV